MNRQTVRMAAVITACTLLLLFPAGAASIKMIPPAVTVENGESAEIFLVLDDAWAGLAGYDLVIRFSDPAIADIPVITYPSWAVASTTTLNADRSVQIRAMDLSGQVGRGMMNVPLATLKVRGISEGSSSLSLVSATLYAEGGGTIYPDLPRGQVIVVGTSIPPAANGNTGDSLSNVTQSQTSPMPTASPPVIAATALPTPAGQETVQVPLTATTRMPDATPTLPMSGAPGTTGVGPWVWVVLGIGLLGACTVVAFLAWQREREEG